MRAPPRSRATGRADPPVAARRPGAPHRAGRPSASPRAGARPARSTTGAGPAHGGGRAPRASSPPDRTRRPARTLRPRTGSTVSGDTRAWGFTKRSLVLTVAIVFALLALLPPLNMYLSQQQEVSALRDQVAEQEERVEELRIDVARWEDPAYVTAQARERLLFAMPGETQYRLTDSSGRDVPLSTEQRAEQEAARSEWFAALWSSVEGASSLSPEVGQEVP